MPASNFVEAQVLGHLFGDSTWAKPTALYLGALLATPEDDGGLVEVSATGYDRLRYDPSNTNWLLQADGSRINAAALAFAEPVNDWGTVKALGVFDADLASGGNLMTYQDLDDPKVIVGGGALLLFQPGALTWRMNDY